MTKKNKENIQSQLYDSSYKSDPKPIADFVEWLFQIYNLPPQSHILDIGCGTGRILSILANLGHYLTGLEPDTDYFESSSNLINDNINVVKGGFNSINQNKLFDAVIAINDPFNYLLSLKERIDAIKKVFDSLKPGGIIFLDLANFLWILNNYKEPKDIEFKLNEFNVIRHVEHEIDFHHCIWKHTDTFSFNENSRIKKIKKIHKLAIITYSEVEYYLNGFGFKNILTFKSYKSRRSELLNGPRMMVSGQKII